MRKQRKHKKKTYRMANISLGVMGAGFAATLPFSGTGMALLQGGFEAGLVGGLADWFAVTALFRHPLGIKIPHTALLPKNREKMVNAIKTMVETELLNRESVTNKIKSVNISGIVLNKLKSSVSDVAVQDSIIRTLQIALDQLSPEAITKYAANWLDKIASNINEEEVLESLFKRLIREQADEQTLNYVLERAEQWVSQDEAKDLMGRLAMQRVNSIQLNGLMKFALGAFTSYLDEDKLGSMLQTFLLDKIREWKIPDHQERYKMLYFIQNELLNISKSTKLMNQLRELKVNVIENWKESGKLQKWIEQSLQQLSIYIQTEEFRAEILVPMLQKIVDKLDSNPLLLEQMEEWVQEQAAALFDKHHSKIGDLVEENLNKLDNDALIELIEDKVGHDLQWIRLNGAVCGFIVGIILTTLKLILV